MSSVANPNLDPVMARAENTDVTPQDKITALHKIIKSARTGMLTTRSEDGQLHSRAMIPSSPYDTTQLSLIFLANNASHKFDEIKNDSHVNVSFVDSETNWASFSGSAKISQDRELIKKHWSSSMAGYFSDLKDGVHKGDENDPRVAIIEVVPDEIRYWLTTKGTIGRAVDTAVSAVTKGPSVLGELRTITKAEIQLAQGLHHK